MPDTNDRKWRLNEDLIESDNLLDNVTFKELITTVRCNCPTINNKAVRDELKRILEIRRQDMEHLLEENMDVIIAEAKKGRE